MKTASTAIEKPVVNVGDTERAISAVAGSLLLYALAKKKPLSTLFMLGSGYLLYRAVTGHCSIYSIFGHREHADEQAGIKVRTHLIVSKPREEVYAFWRRLENLPLFMGHVEHIDELDTHTSAWKLKLPGGDGDIRWETKIVKEEEGKELSWHSVPGAAIETTGKINFADTPGKGTRIDVMLTYRAPAGAIGERLERLLTPGFRNRVEHDIHQFKHYLENERVAGVNGHAL